MVMGIIALMAFGSMGLFSNFLARMRQEAGLTELALTVERARIEAMRLGVRVYVGFFKSGGRQSYFLFREMMEEEETLGEGSAPRLLSQTRSLPDSLECRVEDLPFWNGAPVQGVREALTVLSFSPLGSREGASEVISIEKGGVGTIASLQVTSQGPVRFAWETATFRQ